MHRPKLQDGEQEVELSPEAQAVLDSAELSSLLPTNQGFQPVKTLTLSGQEPSGNQD